MTFVDTYRDIVKRLLSFVDGGRTHYADDLLEMPVSFYFAPEQYGRELERIFQQVPLLLCLSSDLAGAGSWRTFDVIGVPIIVLRNTDGSLRAFINACRHRGAVVASGRGEGARRLTCPFHAWSYDLEGSLVGMPHPSAFEGLCREERSLVPLPVAERHGLVFVRVRPGDQIDIDRHLGELGAELSTFGFDGFRCANESHVHEIAANWKLVMDTFNEVYHFSYLHSRTGGNLMYGDLATIDSVGKHIRHGFASKSIDSLRSVPEEEWTPVVHVPYHYVLFPNISLTVVSTPNTEFQPASYKAELNQVYPVGIDRSIVVHTAYTATQDFDEEARQRELEMIQYTCTAVLDQEDFWVAGQEQRTLASKANKTFVYGRNERGCQIFNTTLLSVTSTTLDELRTWGDEIETMSRI